MKKWFTRFFVVLAVFGCGAAGFAFGAKEIVGIAGVYMGFEGACHALRLGEAARYWTNAQRGMIAKDLDQRQRSEGAYSAYLMSSCTGGWVKFDNERRRGG